jgi:cytochrome c-type biogenesis protein CcmH
MFSIPAIGWIAIVIAALAVAASASFARTSLQQVSEALTCQCGCGLTVSNCNHPQCEFSVPIRSQIEKMIDQGMNQRKIIAFFRSKYGEKILSAPPIEGFNVIAWVLPFAAVFSGCLIIVSALSSWRSSQRNVAEVSANDVADNHELRLKLEEEIREER